MALIGFMRLSPRPARSASSDSGLIPSGTQGRKALGGSGRNRTSRWLAGLLGAALLAGPAFAQMTDEQRADRLLYREALYHIYNNDYFRALTLLENEHTGANHVDNSYHNRNHLLAVRSALHLNMYGQARGILEHLQFTSRDELIQDLARVYRGKLHYQEGKWQEAIEELRKASSRISQEERDEAGYYLAMSHLKLNQAEQAATVLGKMNSQSLWTAYGYYNLAMHYAKADGNPVRALIALRVAASMVNSSPEGLAISDRIHLDGGYLALREGEHDKAMTFLRKVRMKGESAPAALYFYGQAYAAMGQHRAAVQIWHRAKKYSLVLPGVAESFQAIGYGFEQEQLRTSAIESYLEAIRVYEKEMVQLEELTKDVRRHGVLKALLEGQAQQDVEWFLLTDVVTNTPKVGFIGYLMSDRDFYARAKSLLELRELQANNEQVVARLKVFDDMLARQQRRLTGRIDGGVMQAKAETFNRLVEQRNRLAREVDSAQKEQDYIKFASSRILAQYARLERLEKAMGQDPKHESARERIRLMRGLLIWQAMHEYEDNSKRAVRNLAELDEQLRMYRDNLGGFKQRVENGPAQLETFRARIAALRSESQRLGKEMDSFIQQENRALTELALQLLGQHRDSMNRYRLESQMALVNLFDAQTLALQQPSRPRATGSEGGQ